MIDLTADFTDSAGTFHSAAPFTLKYIVRSKPMELPTPTGESIKVEVIRYEVIFWNSMQEFENAAEPSILVDKHNAKLFMFLEEPKADVGTSEPPNALIARVVDHLKTVTLPRIDPSVVVL